MRTPVTTFALMALWFTFMGLIWCNNVAEAQSIREEFYVTNGQVRAAVLSGNTLYIGGDFALVGPWTGSAVPIDSGTGMPVSGFPEIDGTVNAVIPDGSGGWYIGGIFTIVGGIPRSNLAHVLSDNSVSAWSPNANGEVNALAMSGTTVYAGGLFTSIGGQTRNRIAALDATVNTNMATAWNPNASGTVFALAVSGTTVYAGGSFTSIGGQTRNRIAALDATVNTNMATAWNPNASSTVSALAVSGTTVYAGGAFTSIGGQTRNRIAALDATINANMATAWNPNANNVVYALEVSGTTVYAGGAFISIGGQIRTRIAALDATVNTNMATAWEPNANDTVHALAVSGTTVYAGGEFTAIGGQQTRHRIAALDATVNTNMATAWDPRASGDVYTLAVSGTTVYAGGVFTSIGGQVRNRIAALDATTGAVTAWDPNANDNVHTLAVRGTTVYAGGEFTSIGGQLTRHRIAALDASVNTNMATAWDPNANGDVYALAVSGTTVYAGGSFTSIGGQIRNRIAALDATINTNMATAWDPDVNGSVSALAVSGTIVYAGGGFANIGGQIRNRIAALDATTGAVTPWDPNAGDAVLALALSGTTVYAGGNFTNIGGLTRNHIAALDATVNSNMATAWNPNAIGGGVRALALSGTTVYAGGFFTSIDDLPHSHIAAIDRSIPLSPWNSLWHANMDLYPDAFCSWVLLDTAELEDPALSNGSLTLATSIMGENLFYEQTNDLAIPDTLLISAQFKVVSESHLVGNPRRGVGIEFAVAPDSANFLFVGRDTLFLWSAFAMQGATAFVDTDDTFHTYDIKVINRSAITVYQDNAQILTGSIVGSGGNITEPTLAWGDLTLSSSAVSEWTFFRHNASTIDCGTPVAVPQELNAVGNNITLIPYPNPTRGPLTLAIRTGLQTGPARLRIYDVGGRMVRHLEAGLLSPGTTLMTWDGIDDGGQAVSSGTYFLRLETSAGHIGSRKIVILR